MMVAGRWTGTMNLTEPHCGTDLGLLRTRAASKATAATSSPVPRSSSRPASTISPRTSCISCSRAFEARPPAAGDFVVPGAEINAGRPTARSATQRASRVAAIEHKMGINGNADLRR